MRRLLLLTAALMLAVVLCSPVLADDVLPPGFRGDPLTCLFVWEFTSPPISLYDIDPDTVLYVGDQFHELYNYYVHINYLHESLFWDPLGFIYTTDQPTQFTIELNNWIDEYPYKHLWIQVTYGGQGIPTIAGVVSGATIDEPMGRTDLDANHFVEYWRLQPNPTWERVIVDMPPYTTIDEIVIDTWSTDSPVRAEQRSWGEVKSLYR